MRTDLQFPQHHLLPGERILWVGRPDERILFAPGDAYLIPFSIFWAGFAVFWEAGALRSGAGPLFAVWGIPFVAIGLYLVVGRFFYKRYRKRRTLYAVTTRRALILTSVRGERLDAVFLNQCPAVTKRVHSNGVGSISFGSGSVGAGSSRWLSSYENSGAEFFNRNTAAFGFYDIHDAEEVYRIVTSQQAG